jgi:hypothetical protein
MKNSASPDDTLKNLDSMISKMKGLKRKLEACAEEEQRLQEHSEARIKHLNELYAIQSLDDVKYGTWGRTRLDRLLVDYMLRNGFVESAKDLTKEAHIEELVDTEAFVQMNRIRESLIGNSVTEALAWCNENKKELRKTGVCVHHYHLRNYPLTLCRANSSSCSASNNTSSLSVHRTRAACSRQSSTPKSTSCLRKTSILVKCSSLVVCLHIHPRLHRRICTT